MACSCAFKISLKNVQPSWTASQETVLTKPLNRASSLKVLDRSSADPLACFSENWKLLFQVHFAQNTLSVITSPTRPSLITSNRSWGSLIVCVRQLSSTRSRNVLDQFLVLYCVFSRHLVTRSPLWEWGLVAVRLWTAYRLFRFPLRPGWVIFNRPPPVLPCWTLLSLTLKQPYCPYTLDNQNTP